MVADDLDRVLVGADGTVTAETPELAGYRSGSRGVGNGVLGQRVTGHIVNDTDSEALLRLVGCEVLVNGKDRRGGGVLRAETVAAADDLDVSSALAGESGNDVKIERLAERAGLLGAVKHRDLLYAGGNSLCELVRAEGTIKSYLYKTDLFAVRVEVVDDFLGDVADRTHSNDNALCIGCAVVVEETVVGAELFVYLIHIFLDDSRELLVVGVARLAVLEEDIAVFGRTAENGVIGIERACAELLDGIPIDHILEILKLPDVDLLDLVRGAEAVKEVKYGNSALDSGKMSHGTEVHDLLLVGLAEHCITGLTTCVYVGVVAEYVQRVRGDAARRDVDNAGKQLACHFVHIGDHKEQTLGGCIGGGESAGGKRAVNGTRGTCLGLHFDHFYSFTENVAGGLAEKVLVGSRPCVGDLGHRARGSDGVDGGDFGEGIRNVCRSGVAVH